jgi:hypothetical protein
MKNGRKPLQVGQSAQVIPISMAKWEVDTLKKYCDQYGLSRSELVRFIFEVWRNHLSKYAPRPG